MSVLIPYEVIIERVKDDIDFIAEQAYERGKRDILEQLQTTPTDHVLCKDCKHCEMTDDNYSYCYSWQRRTYKGWYCVNAKKRDTKP